MVEIAKIEVGAMYKGNNRIRPRYLIGADVKVERKTDKAVIVSNKWHPNDLFSIMPKMLDRIH